VEPDPAVDFIALPYVVQPAQYERIEVLRMSVPVAELIAAGLRVQADPGELVEADVLFGQDRRARAVRIVYQ
jgi:invasion protein IalB